jgi:hypothetical protein
MCLGEFSGMPNEGRRHACGQGHLSKEQVKRPPVSPGIIPAVIPVSSPLATRLREIQENNIKELNAKRKREEEEAAADDLGGLTPSEIAANENAKKARTPGNNSPSGGNSPAPAQVPEPTPSPAPTPATAGPRVRSRGGKSK